MGKRIAIVALFTVLGLGVGVGISASRPNPRAYQSTFQFGLPVHSRASLVNLAAKARNQHVQGVRVLVYGKREFSIVGYGSSGSGAAKAVDTAMKALPSVRTAHPHYLVAIGRLEEIGPVYSVWPAVIGLALGLAIGILAAIVRSRRAAAKPDGHLWWLARFT